MARFYSPQPEDYGMAKKGKNGSKKAASREVLVVGSKVKDVVKSAGLQSSGDLVAAISDKVHDILSAALKRAEGNGRKTVRPYDL
jgi:hypothetical protein